MQSDKAAGENRGTEGQSSVDQLVGRLKSAHKRLCAMVKENRPPKTSIPIRVDDDDDMVIGSALAEASCMLVALKIQRDEAMQKADEWRERYFSSNISVSHERSELAPRTVGHPDP